MDKKIIKRRLTGKTCENCKYYEKYTNDGSNIVCFVDGKMRNITEYIMYDLNWCDKWENKYE